LLTCDHLLEAISQNDGDDLIYMEDAGHQRLFILRVNAARFPFTLEGLRPAILGQNQDNDLSGSGPVLIG
jgi:hypothetical protein